MVRIEFIDMVGRKNVEMWNMLQEEQEEKENILAKEFFFISNKHVFQLMGVGQTFSVVLC